MDKIYIATTTLNFNNIMATESISPQSFYKNRVFGYKRFEEVKPNPLKNCIIGYSKIPKFLIKDEELDNYPLIFEISKDLVNDSICFENKICDITIYQLNKTLYLHPNRVKILFFDEKEKNICLIKSNPSIETKFLPLYQNSIEVIKKEDNSFKWKEIILKDIKDIDIVEVNKEIDKDSKLNQIKGFYFAYHLGFLVSKEEKNKEYVSNLIQKLEKVKKSRNSSKEICIEYIENKELDLTYSINFEDYKLHELKDNVFVKDLTQIIYKDIINTLSKNHINNIQTFLEKRKNLVYDIGDILKKNIPKWEESGVPKYLNGLLDNIENYKSFNINTENELLKSIAIFILKGEDLEKLFESLKTYKMKDYRMAFGLWGATFGFSSIQKTMSNILFEKDYLKETEIFYKDVQKKLHNLDISEKINIKPIIKIEVEVPKIEKEYTKKYFNKEPEKSFDSKLSIIYEWLKKNFKESKITDLKMEIDDIKQMSNKDIKKLVKEDSRFKIYKDGSDYIKIID